MQAGNKDDMLYNDIKYLFSEIEGHFKHIDNNLKNYSIIESNEYIIDSVKYLKLVEDKVSFYSFYFTKLNTAI